VSRLAAVLAIAVALAGCSGGSRRAVITPVEIDWPDAAVMRPPADAGPPAKVRSGG
jgi:hypothetical protein